MVRVGKTLTNQLSQPVPRKLPLRVVLVVPFLLQIFLALGLTGYLAFRTGQRIVNGLISDRANEIVYRVQEKLSNFLAMPPLVNQTNVDGIELGLLQPGNSPVLERYLWKQIQQFDQVSEIGVGTATGQYLAVELLKPATAATEIRLKTADRDSAGKMHIYSLDPAGNRLKLVRVRPNYDPRQRPWYRQAVQAGQLTWGDIYHSFSDQHLAIAASQPFFNPQRQLMGVVNAELSLARLDEFLQNLKISPNGQILILERSGVLVASSTATPNPVSNSARGRPQPITAITSSHPLTRATAAYIAQALKTGSNYHQAQDSEFQFQGKRQLLLVMPFDRPGLDWLIAVVIPEADFMTDIHANTRYSLLLGGGAVILATLLGLYTSRWISRPILRLSQAAQAIAQCTDHNQISGKLAQQVQVRGITELEVLGQAFNQMAIQLQQSFTTLEQTNAQLEQRVARRTVALRQAEAELRGILAAMTELILVFDVQGKLLKIVQTDAELLEQPNAPVVGKTLLEVLPSPQIANLWDCLQQVLSLQQTCQVEYSLKTGEQENWYAAIVSPIDQDSVIFVARDITEQHRLEENMARNLEAEKQLNELKSRFVSMTSHEFRTPLTTILSSAELLESHSVRWGEPRDLKHLQRIQSAVRRMTELLNDVLLISRAEAGRLEFNPVILDLHQFLTELVAEMQGSAPLHNLQLTIAGNCSQTWMDEKLLHHILPNLINNAIKYSPQGGTILINLACQGGIAQFQIQDQGIGIPAADLPHLFESFHRAKNVGNISGTGLGLAIVKKSVDLHGGQISVESEVGMGTKFTLVLPIQCEAKQA